MKRLATDASVAGKDIIKNSDSLFNAVNYKTKIHLAVMTEEYIRTTLLNQQIETLLEDVHTLPGTLHIHRVKKDLQGKIITGQCKNDECSIIYPWKHFSKCHSVSGKSCQRLQLVNVSLPSMKIVIILERCSKCHQEQVLKFAHWNGVVKNSGRVQVARV